MLSAHTIASTAAPILSRDDGLDKIPPFLTVFMHHYFVRLGSLGEIQAAHSAGPLRRGERVLVRTERGVELAEIAGSSQAPADAGRAEILRRTTREDDLLIERLQRHKREAVEACRQSLAEAGSRSVLLDVDQLFDGGTLLMHFLGPVDAVAESVTQNVVSRYESIVRTSEFAKLLSEGCGPGCGSDEGSGCGGGCAGCAVAAACHTG